MWKDRPLPASPGWRTISRLFPAHGSPTLVGVRLCVWAPRWAIAPAFTPAGPPIQLEVLSNIIYWVFWVRCFWCAQSKIWDHLTMFLMLSPVPPQIQGDSPVFGIQEEKVRMNGSLTLSCMTKGFPEPKIRWFKDGQVGEQACPFTVTWIEHVQPLLVGNLNCNSNRADICRLSVMVKQVNHNTTGDFIPWM